MYNILFIIFFIKETIFIDLIILRQ